MHRTDSKGDSWELRNRVTGRKAHYGEHIRRDRMGISTLIDGAAPSQDCFTGTILVVRSGEHRFEQPGEYGLHWVPEKDKARKLREDSENEYGPENPHPNTRERLYTEVEGNDDIGYAATIIGGNTKYGPSRVLVYYCVESGDLVVEIEHPDDRGPALVVRHYDGLLYETDRSTQDPGFDE